MQSKIKIPNYENYYLDLESKKVVKKQSDGEFKKVSHISIGGTKKFRLTLNGERTAWTFEELMIKCSDKFEADIDQAEANDKKAEKPAGKIVAKPIGKKIKSTLKDGTKVTAQEVKLEVVPAEKADSDKNIPAEKIEIAAKPKKKMMTEAMCIAREQKRMKKILSEVPQKDPEAIFTDRMKDLKLNLNKLSGKLSFKDIDAIMKRLGTGEGGSKIAKDFKVDPTCISKIKRGVLFGAYTGIKIVNSGEQIDLDQEENEGEI